MLRTHVMDGMTELFRDGTLCRLTDRRKRTSQYGRHHLWRPPTSMVVMIGTMAEFLQHGAC